MSESFKAWVASGGIDLTQSEADLYRSYSQWLKTKKVKILPISYVKFRFLLHRVQLFGVDQLEPESPIESMSKPTETPIEEISLPIPIVEDDGAISEEEIFKQIEDYTRSVCDITSTDYSLIVSGDPGLGKTVSVLNTLEECLGKESSERQFFVEEDMEEGVIYDTLSQEEELETSTPSLEWKEGPTKVTPLQLYIFLYKENGKVLLFDDADVLIDDSKNFDILKKVLDSKKVRSVGYGSKPIILKKASLGGSDITVPNSFVFNGRIIVVTNKSFSKIDTALKSRSLVIEVDLSSQECLKRVQRLLPFLLKDNEKATMEVKQEVLNYLLSISDLFKKIDLRTVEQSILEYFRSPSNWQQLVKKSIQLKTKTKTKN